MDRPSDVVSAIFTRNYEFAMSGQPCINLASAITIQQKEAAVDSGVVLLDTAIPPFVIFVTEGNLIPDR